MKKQILLRAIALLCLSAINICSLKAQNWLLTGNAGTTPGTNFLGTTDAKALMFRTNNQVSGYIDFGASKANTSMGFQALKNLTGVNNAAFGFRASSLNTTGSSNTSVGSYALYNNTSGYSNVAIGVGSLFRSTISHNLVAVGDSALYNLKRSGTADASGNTAVGSKALYANDIGYNNTANGFHALYSTTGGHNNTAIGAEALYSNTGIWGGSLGSYNVATGLYSLHANTDGYGNTATGSYTLIANTTGTWNTALGYSADANAGGYSFSMALGSFSEVTASYQVRIGDNGTTSIGGYTNWSNISDVRVKKNIKQNVPGLAFINKLQPITYNLDLEVADRITHPDGMKNKDDKQVQPTQDQVTARKAKEQIVYTGFAAQAVEKAAKELNYDFSGVDAAKNSKDLYGLRYSDFVVPLVKAVQELSRQNDELKKQNDEQQKINASLQSRLDKLEKMMNVSSSSSISRPSASLQQNTPNPFNGSTTISYSLPPTHTAAKIIIVDKSGNAMKEINVSGSGRGSIDIDNSALLSGAYSYSLYVNGTLVDTKQMILLK